MAMFTRPIPAVTPPRPLGMGVRRNKKNRDATQRARSVSQGPFIRALWRSGLPSLDSHHSPASVGGCGVCPGFALTRSQRRQCGQTVDSRLENKVFSRCVLVALHTKRRGHPIIHFSSPLHHSQLLRLLPSHWDSNLTLLPLLHTISLHSSFTYSEPQ